MMSVLSLINLLLGACAVVSGVIVVHDLISGRFNIPPAVFFLRCTLGSSIAALFFQEPLFQVHHLLPAQKVAVIATYGTGTIVLAWCRFRLRGAWRKTFVFSIVMVLYLNVLGLSVQLFPPPPYGRAMGLPIYVALQGLLFVMLLLLGFLAVEKGSDVLKEWAESKSSFVSAKISGRRV